MNPEAAGDNGVTVFNQVIPPNGQNVIQMGPNVPQNTPGHVSQALQEFVKGEPKALGIIQIMISLVQFILAIVLVSANHSVHSFFTWTGFPFWSSVFFISSGSLTVAAQNKANMCLVKFSKSMNNLSSLIALIGIILLCIDLGNFPNHHLCEYYSKA
ncbi:membrane-spanning 4-domains subfamily A member 4A-like [Microcaecilia unicolor]|uniref:Membrane-spanning 4-domains subfamily A member 4A-like n=1 Tax=Microcaecilia unicolor TaxID=1415580 RepID=A0A6P7WT78_9AMPH|nr:membrane-spanning 4-domains subfamily A member 4A-like [Microcaecilia unicolor]